MGETMNYGQQENVRVKNQIVDGLFKELETKKFSEIRIASLIKSAGVGRVSYYRNFDNKEEILDYYLQTIIETRQKQRKTQNVILTKKSVKQDLSSTFLFFLEQKDRFLLLFNSGLSAYVIEYFRSISNELHHQDPQLPNNLYLTSFLTGALSSVLFEWLQRNTPETPDEMADIVLNLLPKQLLEEK
ncbi:hypothetical protein R078131_01520 [Convivina intestini]|nr:hypothetical protein R078131_01520 [Convivina intestini]